MPTIYDVARKAGVGIGTVSRALNDSPNISPQTKEKVLRVAREMGYQPHALARGLARKRTGAIGAIVPFLTNYFYLELLKGIQHEISRSKYDLILYSADDVARGEDLLERVLRERRVDGVLYISMPLSNRMARKVRSRRLPVVLVDSYHPEVDSIHVENQLGAYQATRYLLDLGYRRLGMINGKLRSFPARERRQGFLRALSDFGLEPRAEWMIECDDLDGQDGFNAPAGYRAMIRLLELDEQPEALFVASDVQAYGVLRAARERGVRIPDDLALVAFDDIQPSELIGLSTVRQPMFEMGQRAVKRLAEKLENGVQDLWHEALGTRLVIRSTCGGDGRKG
ncbi:MAG: LacI family transcriptional regulator [candidate division KSB1 bacterium]|nr:LacI family transcriptional regulator [candidate division KSB1 bacterium]